MKTRYVAKIALLALIVLLGALPAAPASSTQLGDVSFHIDGSWYIGWKTLNLESSQQVQWKAARVTEVWTSLSYTPTYDSTHSYMKFNAQGSDETLRRGIIVNYRVKVRHGDCDWGVATCWTPWKEIEVVFYQDFSTGKVAYDVRQA